MSVKKIIISIIIIVVVFTACFFAGVKYSEYQNRFDDNRINEDTELIEKQKLTIETIRKQLSGAITKSDELIKENRELKTGLDKLREQLSDVRTGLSEDINGIQGVIDCLIYYKKESLILEKNDTSN